MSYKFYDDFKKKKKIYIYIYVIFPYYVNGINVALWTKYNSL